MNDTENNIIAAIHQPSFFPWLGFFNKIVRSDVFVVLDNVQFPKTGGYWANRVKFVISGKGEWITMPINRNYSGTKNINEIEIDNTRNWNEKALKSIEVNYKKAPYFDEMFPIAKKLLSEPGNNLLEFNLLIINTICGLLGIDTSHFRIASQIETDGAATDLLISIVKQTGCNVYMCGGGATKYQEDEKFSVNGIKLIYQNFKHPVYTQFNTNEFIPGLSVIDALMNCGVEETKKLINQ
jgi:hypothetical protein